MTTFSGRPILYWSIAIVVLVVAFIPAVLFQFRKIGIKYFSKNTLLGSLWRAFSCLADWKGNFRTLIGKGRIDVCFVTNMRDETDRKNFLGNWRPKSGHFNGPRYYYRGVIGRTRALDITAEEMATENGRRIARNLFIKACEWAEKKGAKVILLAAGTKRLFKENAEDLKRRFPRIIFTIGDNGTMLILRSETLQTLVRAGLKPGFAKISVLGPYGFLGEQMVKALLDQGYSVTGIGPNVKRLASIGVKYSIPTANSLDAGKFDAIVACSHSEKIKLTASNIDWLRNENRKLLVIDVAEPSNLKKKEFKKVQDKVIRIDSGNAFSSKLQYVLGRVTYGLFRLSKGVTFGCFAESLAIGRALKQCQNLPEEVDWFFVSDKNMEIVKNLFEESKGGFTIPSSRSYGKPVNNFNLDLINLSEQKESRFIGQALLQNIADGLASLIL